MTITQYRTAVAESANYTDCASYVSDLANSSIWDDPEGSTIPAQRLEDLTQIWEATHRGTKGTAAAAGLSCRKLADRFAVPYRTMEDWSAGKSTCPIYVRLMMQELLGIYSPSVG